MCSPKLIKDAIRRFHGPYAFHPQVGGVRSEDRVSNEESTRVEALTRGIRKVLDYAYESRKQDIRRMEKAEWLSVLALVYFCTPSHP